MRWPLIIANTPFPLVPEARLYDDTWRGHVLMNHPEMSGKEGLVKATLESPHIVWSASKPDYYSFVSNTALDPRGKPLIVVVTTVDPAAPTPVVATAYYGNIEYLNPAQTKWTKHWPL